MYSQPLCCLNLYSLKCIIIINFRPVLLGAPLQLGAPSARLVHLWVNPALTLPLSVLASGYSRATPLFKIKILPATICFKCIYNFVAILYQIKTYNVNNICMKILTPNENKTFFKSPVELL